MLIKTIVFFLFFNLISFNLNAAQYVPPKVGDYLVAKISSISNDYGITKRYYQRLHRSNPDNLLALDRLLLLSILDGDLLSANNYSFKLAKAGCDKNANSCCMNNQSPQGHLINGISYLNSHKYGYADQSFASIWNGNLSESTFVRLLRAWVWADSLSMDKSISLIDLISENEHQHLSLVHKALIYDYTDEIELAQIFYDQSLSIKRDLYVLRLYYNFLHRNNLTEKKNLFAEEYLSSYDDNFKNKFLTSNKNRIIQNPLQGIGVVLFNSHILIEDLNSELAHMLFQLAIDTSPNLHEIKYIFSSFLNQIQNHDKAREVLSFIPKKHYLGNFAAIQISDAYSFEGNNEKAIQNLDAFVNTEDSFEAYLSLGNYYRYEKKWSNAIEAYNKALIIGKKLQKENIWEIYFNIGIVHEQTKNWELSEKNLTRALILSADQADVLNYLGYSYIDMNKNISRAKKMIEKAMTLKPDDPYIIDSLAWYYFKVGKYNEALALLDFSLDMMPYDPTVNDHYGDVLWMLGNKLEARYYWKKVIVLDRENIFQDKIKIKLLKGI